MDRKMIDKIVWWIPFRKLRNNIRKYLEFTTENFYMIHSSYNDFIINKIFSYVNTKGRFFIKIGIKDLLFINCNILLSRGWDGIFLDKNDEHCNSILEKYYNNIANSNLIIINELITEYNVNKILYKYGATLKNVDLLLINIKDNTRIVDAINIISPSVLGIKYSTNSNFGLDYLIKLFNDKHYFFVEINLLDKMAFFLKKELCCINDTSKYSAYDLDNKIGYNFNFSNIEFEHKGNYWIRPSTISINTLLAICKDLIGLENIKTVFEFGSRYGEDTFTFAKKLTNATIYGFECNPNTLDECKLRVSKHNNIILTEAAVSDSDGTITFYSINKDKTKTDHLDGNQGASSTLKASGKYLAEKYVQDEVKVKSIRLDTFMKNNNIDIIDILWMDIQGGELSALKGLGDRISDVKIIYSEVEFVEIYENQPLFYDIKNYLDNKNFYFLGFMKDGDGKYFSNAIFINKKYSKGNISFDILDQIRPDQTRPDQTRPDQTRPE